MATVATAPRPPLQRAVPAGAQPAGAIVFDAARASGVMLGGPIAPALLELAHVRRQRRMLLGVTPSAEPAS